MGLQTYELWAPNINGSPNFYELWACYWVRKLPNCGLKTSQTFMNYGLQMLLGLQTYLLWWAANINGSANFYGLWAENITESANFYEL